MSWSSRARGLRRVPASARRVALSPLTLSPFIACWCYRRDLFTEAGDLGRSGLLTPGQTEIRGMIRAAWGSEPRPPPHSLSAFQWPQGVQKTLDPRLPCHGALSAISFQPVLQLLDQNLSPLSMGWSPGSVLAPSSKLPRSTNRPPLHLQT